MALFCISVSGALWIASNPRLLVEYGSLLSFGFLKRAARFSWYGSLAAATHSGLAVSEAGRLAFHLRSQGQLGSLRHYGSKTNAARFYNTVSLRERLDVFHRFHLIGGSLRSGGF